MKNKIISLTKVFLKNSYQNAFNINNKNKQENTSKKLISLIGFAILFAYLIFIFGFMSYGIIDMLIDIHQEAMFIGLLFLAIIALVIFQTIFTSLNLLYFSKDIENVLPLPIKPLELLISKFNTIIITEYITEFIFGIGPVVIYGILTSAGILYYVYMLILFLIFPILPAIIACLLMMIIMTFSKLTRNKERFQLISTLLSIALSFIIIFSMNSNPNMTEEQMLELLTTANGIVETIGRYFPTIMPAVDSIVNSNTIYGFISLIKTIAITAVGYIIFLMVGKLLYFKGITGNLSSGSGVKNKEIDKNKVYRSKKVHDAYILKEFKMLFRNPIYFVQCVLPTILMPVIIIISFVLAFSSSPSADTEQNINFTEMLSGFQLNSIIICLIICAIQFFMMMSFTAITAISRDGSNAIFTKYIPISLYKQYLYKIAPSIILNIIPIAIVLGILLFIFPHFWFDILVIFVINMLFNILLSYLMFIVDLKRPKLEWDTEYAVVKQNMNMLYEMIYVFFVMGLLIGLGFLCINLNYNITLGIITIIVGLGIILVDQYVYKNQNKLFNKIA